MAATWNDETFKPIFTITNRISAGLPRLPVRGTADRQRASPGIPGGDDAGGDNLSFGRTFGFQMDAMAEPILYMRFARSRLEEALDDTPVMLVHGPPQCCKITLARMVGGAAGYEYITFDDDVQLALAHRHDAIGDLVRNSLERHQESRRLLDQAKPE
jgi:hypothetical protein